MKDTWEYDPSAHAWTERSTTLGPSPRHDFGLAWDSERSRAILVGGLQVSQTGATPVPKQDTWEWDPTGSGAWTDRTVEGLKPSPRYGHSMAYDLSRKKIVMFGGWNIDTSKGRNDLWEWDTLAFTWTQRLSGNEPGLPSARMYASLVAGNTRGRLELLAGAALQATGPGTTITPGFWARGSNEVWDLDTATPTFTNKTPPEDRPSPRGGHAMAYNPSTRRVYLFGGSDGPRPPLDDLWEYDGKTWARVVTDKGPPGVEGAGLAYDPVRRSLILYGGMWADTLTGNSYTWEWDSTTRQWSKLNPTNSPGPAQVLGMVTDTTRGRILLVSTMDSHVWEWNGGDLTWTDRTPVSLATAPALRDPPVMAYDEGRQRLFLYEGWNKEASPARSASAFWEWDPLSAGWMLHDPGDALQGAGHRFATYDSIRRRVVVFTGASSGGNSQIWELDAKTPLWYVRTLTSAPLYRDDTALAFDSGRGVAVLFGGIMSSGAVVNDVWEYQVTNLGNGEGCTADFATWCASGNCADGVCCETASCTGACKSCNVSGSEGTCKLAQAGTEVPNSCQNGQACDGAGACKSKNGQSCASNATCASGFCVDGICCDGACTSTCVACNTSGNPGKCSPYPVGTDPKGQCGAGTGVCKSTCDGVGACAFPGTATICDSCTSCDGRGQCSIIASVCSSSGGTSGTTSMPGKGGTGGTTSGTVGAGGSLTGAGGAGGSIKGAGGADGSIKGAGGSIIGAGGAGSSITGAGGTSGTGGSITGATLGIGGSGSSGVSGHGGSAMPGPGDASAGGNSAGGAIGSGGASGNRDGGGTGNRDGGSDSTITGTSVRIHQGCSCAVGQPQSPRPEWAPPLALVAAALLSRWIRRRRR